MKIWNLHSFELNYLDKMTLTDKENNNQTVFGEKSDIDNKSAIQKSTKMPDVKLKMPITQPTEAGQALKEVIHQAIQQDRLTCGLYQAGQMLEACPEDIMLCLLPENGECDITLHIHFTLIEAFCWENGIRLMKVDKAENLKKVVSDVSGKTNNIEEQRMLDQLDFNCVLIEHPTTEFSESDEDLIEFYKLTSDMSPPPTVQLPV